MGRIPLIVDILSVGDMVKELGERRNDEQIQSCACRNEDIRIY